MRVGKRGKIKVQITYDPGTHSYKLRRTNASGENCIEISYNQWLKHNQVRGDFLRMQEWIIDMQAKRSEEWAESEAK